MLDHTTQIRVRYADTDQMQFAYNGKYIEYFEVARTEMMREIGLPYYLVEENNFMLPVLEVSVKYKSPAFYDDILIVRAFCSEMPVLKIHIDYTVHRDGGKILVAEGYTEHIFMNSETKKAVRPPKFFIDAIKPFYNNLK